MEEDREDDFDVVEVDDVDDDLGDELLVLEGSEDVEEGDIELELEGDDEL